MGLQATSHILQNLTALYRQYLLECNCIVMRGGVYDEILPEPEGFPEGSGDISSYTPTRVTIQSFSITSTSQYFPVLWPSDEAQYMSVLPLGAIRICIGAS